MDGGMVQRKDGRTEGWLTEWGTEGCRGARMEGWMGGGMDRDERILG
jgi:hypothetical protein